MVDAAEPEGNDTNTSTNTSPDTDEEDSSDAEETTETEETTDTEELCLDRYFTCFTLYYEELETIRGNTQPFIKKALT